MDEQIEHLKKEAHKLVESTEREASDKMFFMLALLFGLILNLAASTVDHVANSLGSEFYRYYGMIVLFASGAIIFFFQKFIKKYYLNPHKRAKAILKEIDSLESKYQQ